MTKKRCSGCKAEYPTSFFGSDASRKDGLASYCRSCRREEMRRSNAKRRDKIRAWERAHSSPCLDCGGPVSDGYRSGSRGAKRCANCSQARRRTAAVARAERMLELRAEGKLNTEIAREMNTTVHSVANALSRRRLRELGLLDVRVASPYWTR